MRRVFVVLFFAMALEADASRVRMSTAQKKARTTLYVEQNSSAWKVPALVEVFSGECSEPAVRDVCNCDQESSKGRQCSSCKNPSFWGYGCALKCPMDVCPNGCDFNGNCLTPDADFDECPHNCKRNSRALSRWQRMVTSSDNMCLNLRGECEACDKGFHGLHCESACPANCGSSPEGPCNRAGHCYNCKTGYHGAQCDQQCPEACPKCLMLAGLVNGEMLPAGSCLEKCQADTYGLTCEDPCPEHCDKGAIPSCSRDGGKCRKCEKNAYFGDDGKCGTPCSSNCGDGTCDMITGECDGCAAGFWGPACTLPSPKLAMPGAELDQETGLPMACVEGYYPTLNTSLQITQDPVQEELESSVLTPDEEHHEEEAWDTPPQGGCARCSEKCAGRTCDVKGRCNAGCIEGFHGKYCDKACPDNCDGPCDQDDGKCKKCQVGKTGPKCGFNCHPSCLECKQYASGLFGGLSPGDQDTDCTSCRHDEPAHFVGSDDRGVCACIEDSSRALEASGKKAATCACNAPEDPLRTTFFEKSPKQCRTICQPGLKEAFGKDHTSLCMHGRLFKSIIRQEGSLVKGECADGELFVPLKDGSHECIRNDYVEDVLKEF